MSLALSKMNLAVDRGKVAGVTQISICAGGNSAEQKSQNKFCATRIMHTRRIIRRGERCRKNRL